MIVWLTLLSAVAAQTVLEPAYFDIAKKKAITATATCGENYQNPNQPDPNQQDGEELYCTLAGIPERFGLRGISCSYCKPGHPEKDHSIQFANDGSNKWWQSPPLSRGLEFKKINVTIDLGQSFHVAYIIVKAANSPRPGVWSLERSNDGGRTYTPWHHFASSKQECRDYFNIDPDLPITRDNTVLCSTEYSRVPPFENGEIHISLINGRPSAKNFSYSNTLQEWTSATNVRLSFLEIKTLLTDLLPLSLKDPSVTRRYYYSIKDISIGGRCMCNGFADECRPTPVIGKYKCNCHYNTEGDRCERCKPGYVQKSWRPRRGQDNFVCEKCICHGHSDECEYNEDIEQRKLSIDINGNYAGGGVCKRCQHNTHGINCEKCLPFFYRPEGVDITDPQACQECNCSTQFSTGLCAEETGQCECIPQYTGRYCDRCNKGYHRYPDCLECDCNLAGSEDDECSEDPDIGCMCKRGFAGRTCGECQLGYFGFPNCQPCQCETRFGALDNSCYRNTGQCSCKRGFSGRQCEICDIGHYQFPFCKECGCDKTKTYDSVCEAGTGKCNCKHNYAGDKCETCTRTYYGYPGCYDCKCGTAGSASQACDNQSGRCECLENYTGVKCDRCAEGYYGYPQCAPCNCNRQGSRSDRCDSVSGECTCQAIFTGQQCDKCLPGFYGFPKCQRCICNPAGTRPGAGGSLGDCSTSDNGQCICKKNVEGIKCSKCKPGTFNLQARNEDGCQTCGCHRPGTNNGMSACQREGDCNCKRFVSGAKCIACEKGYYGLEEKNFFGCTGCGCDFGGSYGTTCDTYGQCHCRPNVAGKKCDKPGRNHYYPTLHQLKFEIEEGVTQDEDAIRFKFDEQQFPKYSWKGYVPITSKQPTVIVSARINQRSNYQLLFKYTLDQIIPVSATVKLYQENGSTQYKGLVNFPSTQGGPTVTTAMALVEELNGKPTFFTLGEGDWKIEFTAPDSKLLLDHLVLVPEEYSRPRDMTVRVQDPCEVKPERTFCNLYRYVSLKKPGFQIIEAEEPDRQQLKPLPLFNDTEVLLKLDIKSMVQFSPEYRSHDILLKFPRSGKYVFLFQYYHDSDRTNYMDVFLRTQAGVTKGKAWIFGCRYTFGCRQVVLDSGYRGVKVFDIDHTKRHLLTLIATRGATFGLDYVSVIPYEEWSMDYVTPKLYCTSKYGKCTPTQFDEPLDSQIVQPSINTQDPRPSYIINPDVEVKYLRPGQNAVNTREVKPGRYRVVVHFYQPNHPTFESRSGLYTAGGNSQPGYVNFHHCPYLEGCRELLKLNTDDSDVYVFVNGQVRFRFDIPAEKDAWIEKIYLVPENSNSHKLPNFYKVKPLSLSQDFVEKCTRGSFFVVNAKSSEFCKDSTFSLTTKFNNGALSCDCDHRGAKSAQCDVVGGQCSCLPDVIGRTCNRCKMGHYGFPNCKPCGCNNCDQVTGKCTCPPGVVGENCDRCAPGMFGFDPVNGCQPCACDAIGTSNTTAQCDIITGQCPCRDNFATRKCSKCSPGFYNYPDCTKCDCHSGGVTADQCDGTTGQCLCQDDVVGVRCDECQKGFFKTESETGEQLCLKCWCAGHTTKCKEAKLYRSTVVTGANPWTASLPNHPITGVSADTFEMQVPSIRDSAKLKFAHWVAPQGFLGDRADAYGGSLTYYFNYTIEGDVKQPLDSEPDVKLTGNGLTILSDQPIPRILGARNRFKIVLLERGWKKADGSKVTRDEFLKVLSRVSDLQIRAVHDVTMTSSSLSNVTLDASTHDGTELVFGLEDCVCPVEYTGPGCTRCAEGFTLQDSGICGKCECLGRSGECDPDSGACKNCTQNTQGDRCEKCKPGFYGDKCQRCPCPGVDSANNFADTCEINADTSAVVCACRQGYAGARCDKCADGYYGDPTAENGSCKPCSCNGNIDLKYQGNCDSVTGECLKCLNNTYGNACELCRPGYHGNAVSGTCADCACDVCGAAESTCDSASGSCACKKNAEGKQCDTCKANTWNFQSCKGCEDCKCGAASLFQQCNVDTGVCSCKPNVIGPKCDWCQLGFTNYSADGCQPCTCADGGYCDVKTGSCDCEDDKCELCPPGYIVENGACVECDSCVRNILNRVKLLITSMEYIEQGLPAGTVSKDSLDKLNQTLQRLTKQGNDYMDDLETMKKAVGFGYYGQYEGSMAMHNVSEFEKCEFSKNPTTSAPATTETVVNTEQPTTGTAVLATTEAISETTPAPVTITTEEFIIGPLTGSCPASLAKVLTYHEALVNSTEPVMSALEKDAYEVSKNASTTKQRAEDMLEALQKYINKLNDTINSVNNTLDNLEAGDNDPAAMLAEARKILEELEARNFTNEHDNVDREKENAENAATLAGNLTALARNVTERAAQYNASYDSLLQTFRNIRNESSKTSSQAVQALEKATIASGIDLKPLLEAAKNLSEGINTTMEDANKVLQAARDALKVAEQAFDSFDDQREVLDKLMDELRAFINDLVEALKRANPKVQESVDHASELRDLADKLRELLTDTKKFAEAAIRAGRVYAEIVDAIYEALDAAKMANSTANQALDKADQVRENAGESKSKAEGIGTEAKELKKKVVSISLDGIKSRIGEMRKLRERIEGRLTRVKDDFPKFDQNKDMGEKAGNVSKRADDVIKAAKDGQDLAEKIANNIEGDKKKVEKVRKDIDDISDLLKTAVEKVDQVVDQIPALKDNITLLNAKHDQINRVIEENVTNSIEYIKFLLNNTHFVANVMPLAMKFKENSKLVLSPPNAAKDGSLSNEISLLLKSDQPDGLVFFAGDKTQPDDKGFVALEVVDSKLSFHYHLNNDVPKTLKSTRTLLHDGTFYKVNIKRNFASASISVEGTADKDEPVEDSLDDSQTSGSILSLQNADFYVGSLAHGQTKSTALKTDTFQGCIDQLTFNGELVGLWDWKSASNVEECPYIRQFNRGQYMFDDKPFVQFEDFTDQQSSLIKPSVKFATYEPNGLIMLGTDPETGAFVSLELRDGYPVVKFQLGTGYNDVQIGDQKVNDGEVHEFKMRIKTKKWIKFWIDQKENVTPTQIDADGQKLMTQGTVFYFGGVPMREYVPDIRVSTTPFIGYIGDTILRNDEKFKQPIAYGNFRRGAQVPLVGNSASLPTKDSSLTIPACDITQQQAFGFSFQTTSSDAQLIASENGKDSLRVYLNKGELVADVAGTEVRINGNLADGEWHTVAISIQTDVLPLSVSVDDVFARGDSTKNLISLVDGGLRIDFVGNVRNVYCGATKVDLSKGAKAGATVIGSQLLAPPLALGESIGPITEPTKAPGTIAPVTTPGVVNIATQEPVTTTTTTEKPVETKSPIEITPKSVVTTTTEKPTTTKEAPVVTTKEVSPEPTTTTTSAPITTTTTPVATTPPVLQCKPGFEVTSDAYLFGLTTPSYLEFGVRGLSTSSSYEFYFFSVAENGLLLTVNMKDVNDYEAVFLRDGKVAYTFNAGAGALLLVTEGTYNDGQWHKVVTNRAKTKGYLTIDDGAIISGEKKGASMVNGINKLYIGGAPEDDLLPPNIPTRSKAPLKGGIKGIKLKGSALLKPANKEGVQEAPADGLKNTGGVHFAEQGGFISTLKKQRVGNQFSVSLKVRPERKAGYLFHVEGGGDYLTIYLNKDGSVVATCNNGGGMFTVEVLSPTLCGGFFSTVSVVKSDKTLKLSVDGNNKEVTTTKSGSSADTNSPMYFGGVSADSKLAKLESFFGCISDVEVNNSPVNLVDDVTSSGAVIPGCP